MVEALSKNSCENSRKISLYRKNITKIEKLICILQRKTLIADPEPAVTYGTTTPITPTSPTNSTTSTNSTNPTESTINSEEESATDANTGKDKYSARCKEKLKDILSNVHKHKKEVNSERKIY